VRVTGRQQGGGAHQAGAVGQHIPVKLLVPFMSHDISFRPDTSLTEAARKGLHGSRADNGKSEP
jgi:hypothetical protein